MAETVQLKVEKREGRGTRKARHLRKTGMVPGVVYGHKQETISVSLSAEELARVIRQGAHVVDLSLDGGLEKALIRDLQWDHLGKDLLHIDFERVSADERIEVPVRIELRGIAPGVTGGGILDQPLHTLTVECLAIAIPDSIRVNINELQMDGAIHVKDLTLPEGVKALADPDAVVVHIKPPAVELEAPVAPAATAEPELIGRPKAEEEAEEKK
ncbi:MAG TPA: 50S ribosomal protein L25 [Gemmataceae bacterium]|nr:50S ribosomal protein L25 [Gemmataceae bacterium]